MTRENLPKSYEPKAVENKWRNYWLESRLGEANRESSKQPFSIVIPPPNVTGRLHMGHALVQTVQDILARFWRMKGREVMWVPGTDHAGIATQTVVERHLFKQHGLRRSEMKREEFLSYCWKWKDEYETSILDQVKLLGCSCDWSMKAFTMDEPRSKAVRHAFKKLFDKGLIYQGDYLVNWDPVSQTALADDEVEYEERQSSLWQIRYPLVGPLLVGQALPADFIEVATTRPETMLGDVAIAVNPRDARFAQLIGQTVRIPLTDREIPIIADDFVDPTFGTGAVKITPAHDPNDYQMAQRHNLEMRNILNVDGSLNSETGPYQGLSIPEARARIVADLQTLGFLVKTTPHTYRVGLSYRSKAVIEPMLSKQWFVKLSAFKGLLREAVETGRVELSPASWQNTYFHWIDNLRDWCISRQLWWGHRIPIWHHKEGAKAAICFEGEGLPPEVALDPSQWQQESDVLDTWFSSALWPLSVMGWPDNTAELNRFYPTSVLVTGHDILFFWVARMMLMCELMSGEMPFSKVYLHGLIFSRSYWRNNEGGGIAYVNREEQLAYDSGTPLPKGVLSRWEKMSKSKGNVIDPVEVIETYGADAMRMALASSLGDARQIDLDRRRFEEYRNFTNKLFNSTRFVLMNLDQEPSLTPEIFAQGLDQTLLLTEDHWILGEYQKSCSKVSESIERFEFAHSAQDAYSFFWDQFCAYYLEISKPVLWGKAMSPAHRVNKQKLLAILLIGSLRLLHPFTPFITEELLAQVRSRLASSNAKKEAEAVDLVPLDALVASTSKKEAEAVDPLTLDAIAALNAPCCMVSSFPVTASLHKATASQTMTQLLEAVYLVRQLRSEMNVITGSPTDLVISSSATSLSYDEEQLMREHEYLLRALLPLKEIRYERASEPSLIAIADENKQLAAKAILGSLTLIVPLPLEMAEAEKARLKKRSLQLEQNIELLSVRLASAEFLAKAPAPLVEKQQAQLAEQKLEWASLTAQIERLDR